MERVAESKEETSVCTVDSSSVLLVLQGPIYLHLRRFLAPTPTQTGHLREPMNTKLFCLCG